MTKSILPAGIGLALILLALVGLHLTACSGDGGQDGPRVNVLFIVVDTLRADRLGCNGNGLGMTPVIDAFAGEGVLFRNAYSHAPWTLPSFASMMTSTHPSQHGAGGRLGAFTGLRRDANTLAESFQQAGYKTAAVVNVDWLREKFGLTRGFDRIDFVRNEGNHLTRIAEGTTNSGLQWLKKMKSGPFFLMVHYFDPHLVYEPPAAFREAFALEGDRKGSDTIFGEVEEIVKHGTGGTPPLDAQTVRRLEALHNGEVAYTDREVGRLLEGLAAMGLDRSTLVVITADHGEEFHDHGGFEHGHTVYDELLHVPLLARLPDVIPAGKVVDTLVRHIDLAPSICRLAFVPAPSFFTGRDLAPLWEGEGPHNDRPLFAEGNFWGRNCFYAWKAEGFKTIVKSGDRSIEIYDMRTDPEEKINLAPGDADLCKRMLHDISVVRRKIEAGAGESVSVNLTPEELERLRQLGYVR